MLFAAPGTTVAADHDDVVVVVVDVDVVAADNDDVVVVYLLAARLLHNWSYTDEGHLPKLRWL